MPGQDRRFSSLGSPCSSEHHMRERKELCFPWLMGRDRGHLVGTQIHSSECISHLSSHFSLPATASACRHKSYSEIILLCFRKEQQKSGQCKITSDTYSNGIQIAQLPGDLRRNHELVLFLCFKVPYYKNYTRLLCVPPQYFCVTSLQ